MSELHYRVEVAQPECHRFRVTVRVPAPAPDGQRVSLAAWTPGSYMIRDFARNVVRMTARSDGTPCTPEKLDKQTWLLPGDAPLEICYELHAWDPSVRAAYLDLHRGFFDGACLFLRVQGQERRPCRVELVAPQDARCADWQAATSLSVESADASGFGTYLVDDYAELIDHPVEMGTFRTVRWEASGVPHRMVLAGGVQLDEARLARDLEQICTTEIALFGEAPFSQYLFLTHVTADGYGGLEHRASTALLCSRRNLPAPGDAPADPKYRDFLGLCSHEYFHAWNVKRIRPRVLQQADLGSEAYTKLLWVFEGFTSYYDDLVLVRSSVISEDAYLETLGQTFTRVLRCAGRQLQSIAESSFDAWTRFYKQDACAPNLIVSYYAKGALVALALDLYIRQETEHARSLDDVMRLLWERHGRQDAGLPEDAMPALIHAATGVAVDAQVAAWVEGTQDPPWADLLAGQGVTLHLRPESSMQDRGGSMPTSALERPVAGWRCEADRGLVIIRHVPVDSPAGAAGLAPDDLLVAVDSLQVRLDELDDLLGRYQPGDRVTVHYLRDGMLRTTEMCLQAGPSSTAWLEVTDRDQLRRWLAAGG